MRKPRMTGKGAKSRICRKDENGKRTKQNRAWANKENKTEQKEGRKWKGKEMNGEGCEKGEKEPGREHPELSEETAGEERNREPRGPSLVPTKASKAKYSRTSPDKCSLYMVFSCLCMPQLVCIISAFFLVLDMGIRWGDICNQIMFSWCFCIIGTFIIVILELYRFPTDFPFCWYNFSITYACYAALICFSASIFYPITDIKFLPYDAS
ncbi:hypothetical protein MG293_014770 [Ovis ammon polii]|uniref:MARVEL domain-containing protein n=2 Tax=Ovis TaxID=9935 RepID=A0A835ZP40_SHEEP|nr:hypothetical protein JEQ12_007690 [Ovis aries]KAI4535544.1 hypothetical protein MG293_014770 [Ovis ammon polii]